MYLALSLPWSRLFILICKRPDEEEACKVKKCPGVGHDGARASHDCQTGAPGQLLPSELIK